MTADDVTLVMPVSAVAPAATPVDVRALDEAGIDRALAELAIALPDRPSLTDRIVTLFSELAATPLRAALATVWAFATVIAAGALLWQPTIALRTGLGPAKATCGVDVFLYGHADPAVAKACRHAEAGRFAVFVVAGLVVAAGIVAALVLSVRSRDDGLSSATDATGAPSRSLGAALRRSPGQSALIAIGAAGVLVGIFALHPAPAQLVRSGQLTTARCGADGYFLGYPDRAVRSACDHAYGGRAHVLVGALAAALLGLVALGQVAYSTTRRQWYRRRLLVAGAVGVLALVALAAVVPVTVEVKGGAAPVTATCGLDTFVAGHPDHAVQIACRRRFADHAALAFGAAVLALLVLGAGAIFVGRARRADGPVVLEAST